MLAIAGAGLGVLLAYRSLGWIVAGLPEYSFPHEADFHVNVPVLLFSVGLAVLTGVFFGLFPALQMSRPEISQVMQSNTRKVAGTVRGKQFHAVLIAGQIALTLLLMTAAGAAIQGFVHMMRIPLGYDPHNVMSVGIPVHDNTYTTINERTNYYEQLRSAIGALPDVVSTGISTNATPPNNGWNQPFELLGKPSAEEQQAGSISSIRATSPLCRCRSGRDGFGTIRSWCTARHWHSSTRLLPNVITPNGDILGRSLEDPHFEG